MPRVIPIALAEKIRGDSTTLCLIVKFMPVQPGFEPFGITTLDRDVEYDDGNGMLTYSAAIGSEPSNLMSTGDLSVSGGETKQLMPVFDTPIDEKDLQAGAYDYAKFVAYMIDYNDTTSGHHIVLQTGTTGRNVITDSGLSWTTEFRGLTQPLKQSITEKWSLTCRAVFGSTVSSAQSRYPCNFNIDVLWADGTVTEVGVDNTQLFTTEGLRPAYGGAPGAVEWLTGDNAGRTDETESFTSSGTFSGTGTFTGSGYVSSPDSSVQIPVSVTGTGTFTGEGGGTFTGTGTYTGTTDSSITGTVHFSGSGVYHDDGTFTGSGTWVTPFVLHFGSGPGTFNGTGTGASLLTNVIGLTFGASYPIQVGDTFRFRDDCPKTPLACQARLNFQNYRGEPSIPVSDNGAMSVGLIGTTVTTTTGD